MASGIGRVELQRLADEKLSDAEVLFAAGRSSSAYYLAGYAVEIGLKAVIARGFRADTLPDPRLVRRIYTHAVQELVVAAGLSRALTSRSDSDPAFARNWSIVADWNETTRYGQKSAAEARQLLDAIGDGTSGILSWIRTCW